MIMILFSKSNFFWLFCFEKCKLLIMFFVFWYNNQIKILIFLYRSKFFCIIFLSILYHKIKICQGVYISKKNKNIKKIFFEKSQTKRKTGCDAPSPCMRGFVVGCYVRRWEYTKSINLHKKRNWCQYYRFV